MPIDIVLPRLNSYTKNCNISDIVDNKVGYVSDFEKRRLCDFMYLLLNNDKLRANFGMNGMQMVKESFDWSNIYKKLEQIYIDSIDSNVRN